MSLVRAMLLFSLGFVWSSPASAFDWSGRIDRLADGLDSSDAAVRRQTLDRLGTYPPAHVSPYLMPALQDQDLTVRITAARILGRGRFTEAVPVLIGWLTEQEEEIRQTACVALGRIGDERAVAPLTRVSSDSSAAVRRDAVAALAAIGTPSVAIPLIGRLGDSHPRVRQAAADGLGQIMSRDAAVPLVSRLQDPVRSVRLSVIGALARIGDPRSGAPLIQSLRDPSPEVRSAALSALTRLRTAEALIPTLALLQDENEIVRTRAVATLGAIGNERAVTELIGCLDHNLLARPAVDALVEVGAPAVAPLCAVLRESSDRLARASALNALTRIGAPEAADTIIDELEIGGGLPEDTLVLALGQVVSERGMMPLIARLDHDETAVRIAALVALGGHLTHGVSDLRAGEALLGRLDAETDQERLLALLLLARIGDSRAADRAADLSLNAERNSTAAQQILPIISSQSNSGLAEEVSSALATGWPERTAAIRALGASGSPAAVDPLLEVLSDRRSALRNEAAQALGRLGSAEVVSALSALLRSTEPNDRAAVILALGNALRRAPSDDARAALEAMLGRNETSLVLRAADALARAGDEEAAPALAELLGRPEVVLRRKAVEVLGELPCAQSRTALLRALEDDDALVRGLALWSLGKIGGDGVALRISQHLDDSAWSVGINAAGALANLSDESTAEAICASLEQEQTSPHRWANLLLASSSVNATCADVRALEAFRRSRLPLVRASAARVLGRSVGRAEPGEPDASRALLRSCRSEDPDRHVRGACREALESSNEEAEAAEEQDWVEFYLYAADRRRIRPRGRFLLILSTGLIKAGVTDANGFAREAPVPSGRYRVEEPSSAPRMFM